MKRRDFIRHTSMAAAALSSGALLPGCGTRRRGPNIVYILADDLGYGDVSCLNESGKISTPAIDRLAAEGVRFTDAHSGSAVCTPTRYGILTGRYSWRTRLQSGVLTGYAPPLIDAGRLTVPDMLRRQGYTTGCVGKWHLGWDWQTGDDHRYTDAWEETDAHVDFSRPIKNGPVTRGFDYFFGIAASLDMTPYVYIENDRVLDPPDRRIAGTSGYEFYREGPIAPGFSHEEVLPECTRRAEAFIRKHRSRPFFLYLPLSAPHTPILPTGGFKGKSGIGPYGDFVLQCDHTVERILTALKENGLEDTTLVIFTSDNGCSPMADFPDLAAKGHHPSYRFRGLKADIYEGGHRIPFIARWPGHIPAGSACSDTICLTDLMATAAEITGFVLPDDAGEDSVSILPGLRGENSAPLREAVVHHSINGSFSIRQGKWKLEFCPGSGGWSDPMPAKARRENLPPLQLYDLSADIGERKNVCTEHPEVVTELTRLMERYVTNGRSTPGIEQANDVEVNWRKS
ncbi:arylsulfatase [bacterium]|nr:arylsulfatase [bacterium]